MVNSPRFFVTQVDIFNQEPWDTKVRLCLTPMDQTSSCLCRTFFLDDEDERLLLCLLVLFAGLDQNDIYCTEHYKKFEGRKLPVFDSILESAKQSAMTDIQVTVNTHNRKDEENETSIRRIN